MHTTVDHIQPRQGETQLASRGETPRAMRDRECFSMGRAGWGGTPWGGVPVWSLGKENTKLGDLPSHSTPPNFVAVKYCPHQDSYRAYFR